MIRFCISKNALRELDEIFVYWARRASLEVADRLVEALEEHFALLGEAPGIGRRCDEIAAGVRCFPAGKYLIYYRKARGSVEILHVFHGARDQADLIGRE
ncbi:MAG: type II toxin-antitoxin system RelE/ParE family toxin [Terracidiphilus sp.]|nr:type II toxin-antitoxin system RelE/ParE family toxin [Terracidiphilus sp.]MDR3798786.1 type II toxin-antitoxin system RelE/ParE family toxin [Terracidiphilus sp.]